MRYIMIDTNYFYEKKFDTETIILKDFKKMIEEQLGIFLYNDILIGEYESNLEKLTNSTKEEFKAFIRNKSTLNNVIPMFGKKRLEQKVTEYEEKYLKPYTDRFFDYIEMINGIDIMIKDIDIEELFDKYFNGEPPFEANKNKKSEFPDAVIFESVLNWIEKEPKFNKATDLLYFVTKDNGLKEAFAPTLVHVVEDLRDCLISSLAEEIERNISENIESDEFNCALNGLLEENIKDYLMEGYLDLDNGEIEAEALGYNIAGIGNMDYDLLAANKDGKELKIIIAVSNVDLDLIVNYSEVYPESGYYDRETGEVFGLEVHETKRNIGIELKLVVELSIDETSMLSKRLMRSIADIESETNLVLKEDLYNYEYDLKSRNASVLIDIEDIQLNIEEMVSSSKDLEDPTILF
ncbi:DUF4935 domain-containing protein [Listeria sp. FSL L7-0993]|uniref:PIN domain-containing protein n=1 Tax=Listeria cossartiae TaxID=2838249 RepID=UPI00162565BA|nr:PIN domain-containing protein [Listeria cossartiae]MBC1806350.1 DUF4935 domain-containing protein [Listeria cossartiae subsp. cayugensis]